MSNNTRSPRNKWWSKNLQGKVARFARGHVVCSDALALLQELPEGCADIVFLDPPFNLGKKYGDRSRGDDLLDDSEYFAYISWVIYRAVSVLREGGALYLYHIPRWAVQFASVMDRQLQFRHWIAISMKNGFVRGKGLYPAHYALLYYTKGDPVSFSRPKIPVQTCRHCRKPIKDYGGYSQYVRDGVNLSDVWDDLSPVRHKKHKSRKSNELPVEIPQRIVEMSGRVDGLFVDPFAGTGTTLLVARDNGMRFVGGDAEQEFCQLIRNRLKGSRPCVHTCKE